MQKLKYALRKSLFIISPLSVVINPAYFIRKGLYKGIVRFGAGLKGSILDFGCGSMPYKEVFDKCTQYIGVDKRFEQEDLNSPADILYDSLPLPVEADSMDSVFCSECLELIPNPDEIVREFYRIVKPGGKILITAPFVWEEHWLPYDFCRFTEGGLRLLLERNGFEVLESQKSTTYFETVWQTNICYLSQNLFPQQVYLKLMFTILIVCPLNIIGIILNALLPNHRNHYYYHNAIVLAQKKKLSS